MGKSISGELISVNTLYSTIRLKRPGAEEVLVFVSAAQVSSLMRRRIKVGTRIRITNKAIYKE